MSDPYSNGVLELAANIPHLGRLDAPDARVHKVSRICGSELTLDITVDDEGRISALGLELQACALGQASASAFARGALGARLEDVEAARDGLKAMLQEGGDPPTGRFEALAALQPAASYRQRHGSILLAFEAAVDALRTLSSDRVAE
ncbi:iron-sulfur cluster assembly scaffold protein [Maricaulaceae bacterium NA33B04]|nr:iron-sulfur cluster assembly scaffold protein [Maricaulaceae bacterium NA33B04]